MVDTAAVAMWNSNLSLLAYLQQVLRKDVFGPGDRGAMERALKKVKVEVVHRQTQQQFIVRGLATLPRLLGHLAANPA